MTQQTACFAAVSSYALLHVVWWLVDVRRDTYPRQCNSTLYALGVWAAYLLLAA